jgi:hypothetical protein
MATSTQFPIFRNLHTPPGPSPCGSVCEPSVAVARVAQRLRKIVAIIAILLARMGVRVIPSNPSGKDEPRWTMPDVLSRLMNQ